MTSDESDTILRSGDVLGRRHRDERPRELTKLPTGVIGRAWARVRLVPHVEFEQNIVRLIIVAICLLYAGSYSLITGDDVSIFFAIVGVYFIVSLLVFIWFYLTPEASFARRLSVTILDRAVITSAIATGGAWISLAFFLYPWVDIGNSSRYGRSWILPSVVLSMIGFVIVYFSNPYWRSQHELWLVAGAALCILCSPLYSMVFYRRLNDVSEKLKELATHDPLTKLPNRPFFYERLNDAIAGAERHQRTFAVMFVDLDNFKTINDSNGHDVGDEALCEAAAALRQAVRKSDTVARLGGDEFVVLLHDIQNCKHSSIRHVAENMREWLRSNTKNRLSASIGIAIYPDCGTDAETLIQHADHAMYKAKAAGKGRSHVCNDVNERSKINV